MLQHHRTLEKSVFKTELFKALAYDVIHNILLLVNLYNRTLLTLDFQSLRKPQSLDSSFAYMCLFILKISLFSNLQPLLCPTTLQLSPQFFPCASHTPPALLPLGCCFVSVLPSLLQPDLNTQLLPRDGLCRSQSVPVYSPKFSLSYPLSRGESYSALNSSTQLHQLTVIQ